VVVVVAVDVAVGGVVVVLNKLWNGVLRFMPSIVRF